MRWLPLIVAFILASLLSLVNVQAYKKAVVTEGVTITVDTTANAALALSSTNPLVTTSNGMMRVDFRQGNGATRDFQQTLIGTVTVTGDQFQMLDVFRITNRGTTLPQCVSVYVSSGTPTNLTAIYGRVVGDPTPGTPLGSALGAQTASRVQLGTAGSGKNVMIVDVHWSATSAVTGSTFQIRVASVNSGTCP